MVTLAQFGNVPAKYAENAEFTLRIINEIFVAFPSRFRFTSGFRSAAQNAAANGVSNSFHLTGEAGDFVPADGKFPTNELAAIADLVGKYGYEVIKHNAGSGLHYHIEPKPSGKTTNPSGTGPGLGTAGMVFFGIILVLLVRD